MTSPSSTSDDRLTIHDRSFRPFLTAEDIQTRVRQLGQDLHYRLALGDPSFLVMLKGAFIFAADLVRASRLGGEIGFVRTASYTGMRTEGEVRLLLPPEEQLVRGKDVVLIEDIVDSGHTMNAFLPVVQKMEPNSVTLVSLLHKPDAQQVAVQVDLVGFTIPEKFVVGYGLDYDGHGRQFPGIWQVVEEY